MTKMLLDEGADPNARNDETATVLVIATLSEQVAIVGLLCTYGAEVNATYQGVTALGIAMGRGFQTIGEILMSHGAR